MAIYKGREVHVLGRTNGEDTSPLYDILDQWNQRSSVKLNELQFTEDEVKQQREKAVNHLDYANVIKQDELQELRDSQDKKKIEAQQKRIGPGPVEVSKVMVDPAEVQDKSTITPQMTKDQRPEKQSTVNTNTAKNK